MTQRSERKDFRSAYPRPERKEVAIVDVRSTRLGIRRGAGIVLYGLSEDELEDLSIADEVDELDEDENEDDSDRDTEGDS